MSIRRNAQLILLACAAILLSACASLQQHDPVQVFVVGVEPLAGQGLELRMMVKLRVQNPNDAPIDYNGVSVQMDVQGKSFASGVSDESGSVPRFGETVIDVPVSVSAFRMARQAIDLMSHEFQGKLTYELSGKLAGPTFKSVRFKSKGDFTMPDMSGTGQPL
jgi:LEA14-like dessication related protein